MQQLRERADDAGVHPAVAALSLDEKGYVLGAALARTPAADVAARVKGDAGARCAAALDALGEATRTARATEIASLAALVRAPVPAGVERIHAGWLRERFEREPTAVLRTVVAGLPDEVRAVAAEVARARGDDASLRQPPVSTPGVAAMQRVVFAGLVPLAGSGGPTTAMARELTALAAADLVRAIETRGAEAIGRSLRGAPTAVVARAAAALDERLAAIVLDAARGGGEIAARDEARRLVAAAGVPAPGGVALAVGVQALAAALADEGDAAIQAVAQRLPPETGRALLAAAQGGA